jgi:hypothetical protein
MCVEGGGEEWEVAVTTLFLRILNRASLNDVSLLRSNIRSGRLPLISGRQSSCDNYRGE